jgi:hypothetical protein
MTISGAHGRGESLRRMRAKTNFGLFPLFYDARLAIIVAVTQHCLRECGLSVSILHTVSKKGVSREPEVL